MKRLFKTHPLLKGLSLLLAIGLWAFVRGEERVEVSANVKVVTENKPENMLITNAMESSINIRISGPRTRLNRFEEENLAPFTINLKDAKVGMTTVRVYEDDFIIPKGTRITRISPQTIRVLLRQAEEKLVKIEPKFEGELEAGFELVEYEVVPPYMKVQGSREDLAALSSLLTEPIHLSGRRKSFEIESRVRLPAAGSEGELKSVTVRVTIREKKVAKAPKGRGLRSR